MKHINIPIFVPHLGCPHDCAFCNQKKITGHDFFSADLARQEIKTVLDSIDTSSVSAEIAFFGGSFTGIDRALMISLLDMAKEFCDDKRVSGIRLSTRPDYINNEILTTLKCYPVKTIELGIQSLSDEVLYASNRGHTAKESIEAMRAVKAADFALIGQMMVGLPSSSLEDEIATISEICDQGANGIRIYPTAVFSNTELENMKNRGEYVPLTVCEAVHRVSELLDIAYSRKVPVIRVGLCETVSLHSDSGIVAGAFHPALGEMCMSAFFLKLFFKKLDTCGDLSEKKLIIKTAKNMLSKAIGQKRININKVKEKYPISDLEITHGEGLSEYEFSLEII